MIEPVRINLPNGLTLEMLPREGRRQGFKWVEDPETPSELWRRFVNALKSTDFEAIVKLYTSAVQQSERSVPPRLMPPQSQRKAAGEQAALRLDEKQVVKAE